MQTLTRHIEEELDTVGGDHPNSSLSESALEIRRCEKKMEILQLAFNAIKVHTTSVLEAGRVHRNQYVLIYRLPNEVLARIFELTVKKEPSQSFSDIAHSGSKSPMVIASVSKRWREVALNNPRMWSIIDADSPRTASLFMERSRSVPLDCYLRAKSHLRKIVLPQIHRVRFLQVHFMYWDDASQFLAPAPRLEELDARGYAPNSTLFGGATPRLRRMCLTGSISIQLTAAIYAGLTRLSLRLVWGKNVASFCQLLHALAMSPLLEYLEIDSVRTIFSSNEPSLALSAPTNIHLLHLIALNLKDVDEWAPQYILARLITPPSSLLEVQQVNTQRGLHGILPASLDNLLNIQSIRHLYCGPLVEGTGCWIRGETSDRRTVLFVCYHTLSEPGAIHQILSGITKALPIPLQSLSIDSYLDGEWSVSSFTEILASFPFIEELSFGQCHPKYIQMLTTKVASRCPRLQKLSIQESKISEKMLLSVVRHRTTVHEPAPDIGSPLRTLEIIHCPDISISPSGVVELQTLLDFRWDKESGGEGMSVIDKDLEIEETG
ncbi:hypothetical protein BOTBODRAFT_144238 [Botryobasidium botryosum FD-172 SS1]|uniref:Uncharacterized protein n=1 Tax=Botryobasidium botryosum (strain FD-172 SS1) TaxID=930990 RepID=A0A067MNT8_BOTB1|nr:hypothetical protein BOTBODRAFT_144238 [Botryobasidium botryosum FD-172 SS1]